MQICQDGSTDVTGTRTTIRCCTTDRCNGDDKNTNSLARINSYSLIAIIASAIFKYLMNN